MRQMVVCFAVFYTMKWCKSFHVLLSTISPPLINLQITPSISMANYSPSSSGNHRSLFVKPAKRGKQRAGGGALFALHHFTFNYQPRHTHNCFISQLGTSCSFDSPELASESEGYPGSFAISENNAVGVVPFIYWYFIEAFHAENVQHLRRWPPHYTYNPG